MVKQRKKSSGSAIALSAALALILVLLGVAFVFITMYMGGSKEVKSAVDAGALNVGKKVLDFVTVDLSGDTNQQFFSDVTTDGHTVDLRNINRVWAKAMLVAFNSDAAGGNAGSGDGNAASAFQGAQAISDALSTKLTTASNLYSFFTDFAQRNSVRMLEVGKSVTVLPGAKWQTSLMDRGDESNIQMPSDIVSSFGAIGYNIPTEFLVNCTRNPVPAAAAGIQFLPGYYPMTVANRTFWQVPFQFDEKPHLVSRSPFEAAMQPPNMLPSSWNTAVPNAFSVAGNVTKSDGLTELAISWVQSNPRETFTMAIPHSFIHIKLDDMKSHWYFFPTGYPPIEFGVKQTYGYATDTQTGTPMPAGGILCSTVTPDSVTLGLDVVGRSLDQIIFGAPSGNTSQIEAAMVNRIDEMITKVGVSKTASDLHSVLSDPVTIGWMIAGQQDFYLFSPDGENLTVQPQAVAIAQAPWLAAMISNDPDGTETKFVDDASTPAPIFFSPIVTPDPFCSEDLALGWGTWEKDLYWTSGTGYNGCLGQVRVKRWTDVYSLGICTPL